MQESFLKAQGHEQAWWGNCTNTFGEELKQITYAEKMGLTFFEEDGRPFQIDLKGKAVLDIGGGPTSLLLKTKNSPLRLVVDPCKYPGWVTERYHAAGIFLNRSKGEDVTVKGFDEVWIYNVLQHVDDPQKIIANAKASGKVVRIFEWVDAEVNGMHPHQITQAQLEEWLGGKGTVEEFDGINHCFGKAFYGTF